MQVSERLRRIWLALRGPKLRTYDAAREELGGVPWRNFASTERWFLVTPPPLPQIDGDSRPVTLDTDAIRLVRPSLFAGRGGYLAAAAGLLGLVLFVAALAGSGAPAAKLPTPPAAANLPTTQAAANLPTAQAAANLPTVATAARPPIAVAQKPLKKRARRFR